MQRDYFDQKMRKIAGNLGSIWEVRGKVIRGRRGREVGCACGYFKGDGVGITDSAEIAEGFYDFNWSLS